jgi:excisionase family DNA binding protein
MASDISNGTALVPLKIIDTRSRLRSTPAPATALWTAADVARYLRTSVSFVYKVTEAGRLPCLRVGAMLRFDPETVRAFARGDATKR